MPSTLRHMLHCTFGSSFEVLRFVEGHVSDATLLHKHALSRLEKVQPPNPFPRLVQPHSPLCVAAQSMCRRNYTDYRPPHAMDHAPCARNILHFWSSLRVLGFAEGHVGDATLLKKDALSRLEKVQPPNLSYRTPYVIDHFLLLYYSRA